MAKDKEPVEETERVTMIWPKSLKADLRELVGARGLTEFTVVAVREKMAREADPEMVAVPHRPPPTPPPAPVQPPAGEVAQDSGQIPQEPVQPVDTRPFGERADELEQAVKEGLAPRSTETIQALAAKAHDLGIDLQIGLGPIRDDDPPHTEAGHDPSLPDSHLGRPIDDVELPDPPQAGAPENAQVSEEEPARCPECKDVLVEADLCWSCGWARGG